MTVGTHGTTFGGNPLAMAVGNAVLDVSWRPASSSEVERKGLLLKQRLAELKDRHPSVIADVRGQGLMMGLRTCVPNTEFVAAARAQKLLVDRRRRQRRAPPAAADHQRCGDRRGRRSPRCRVPRHRAEQKADRSAWEPFNDQTRHFLDLSDFSGAEIRHLLEHRPRAQGQAPPGRDRPKRPPARRQGPGDGVRQALHPHPRLLRCRHARARRRDAHAHGQGDAARPRRDASPTRRGFSRATWTRS